MGSLLRYFSVIAVEGWLGKDFPYGTLTVNLIGSLLIGLLYVLLVERGQFDVAWRGLLIIGFLGGFTTFSSFSLDTIQLLELGEIGKLFINVGGSVVGCLTATYLGIWMARYITS